ATATPSTTLVDDGPVAVNDTATGTEDGGVITIDVLANDTDEENDSLTITSASVSSEYGTVAIVDGKLQFTPAENFNGEATISYEISDGITTDTAEVAVTVDAVNDEAVIDGDVSVESDETDAVLTLSGTLTSTDVDNPNNSFTASTTQSSSGTFTISESGDWTFVANSAFNEMNAGDSKVEKFTVSTVDGTEQVVTITINGTDDAAVISGDTTANLLEDDETSLSDGVISTGGKLTISDVDSEDNPTFDPSRVESSDGTVGSLTISADGTWSYKVDNDKLQTLAQGDELVERFTVYATDGSSEEIVVKVGGVDDVSVISDDTVNTLTIGEDETLTLPLPLEISDIDNGENPSFPAGSINGSFGVFVIADTSTTGSSTWEYQLDTSKVQYLNNGESVQEKITVTASDGTNYELVVNINGSNDAPTVEGSISKAAEEGGDLLTGSIDASDVDSDTLSFSVTGSTPAGFALNTQDGTWSFDPKNPAYNSLGEGDKQDIKVDVLVSDEDGGSSKQTITITLSGTNDDPIATADFVSVSATSSITIDAIANDSDVEGDSLTISEASVPSSSQGSVAIVDNQLVFTPAEGFSGTATINYSISDGKGGTDTSTVTVNVNSVTIDPITSDDVINASEAAGTVTVSGKATGGDISEDDVVTMMINGKEYTTSVDSDGSWSVDVAGSDLAADTGFDVSVESTDTAGNSVTTTSSSTHSVDTLAGDTGSAPIVTITEDYEGIMTGSRPRPDGTISSRELDGDIDVRIKLPSGTVEGDTISVTDGSTTSEIVVNASMLSSGFVSTSFANPGDGETIKVTATLTDQFGNISEEGSAEAKLDLSIATPSISFESTGDDNIYNAAEVGEDGTVTAIISVAGSEVNDKLTYSVDGVQTTITLDADDISNGVAIEVAPGAEVTATLSDAAGNKSNEVSKTAAEADISVAPPVITSVTDDSENSDYSKVTLHGTGEIGAVVTLWIIAGSTTNGNDTQTGEYTELTSVTTTVSSDGTWSLDVSDLPDVAVNDNEFFKVTQTDTAGNVSGDSNVVHYWHGTWTSVNSETGDDFVLLGSGNDTITVDADDSSDSLTVDGGAGHDKAVFSSALSDMQSITLDENGNVIIVDDQGDTNTFIDFESFSFDGVVYSKEALFAPHAEDDTASTTEDSAAITIDVLSNDSSISDDKLTVTAATVSPEQGTVSIVDGKLQFTPAEDFNGEATISYEVSGSDGAKDTAEVIVTVDAVNDGPVANSDTSTTNEDTVVTIDVLANDSDVDDDTLTIKEATVSEEEGTVAIVDGKLQFTPAENFYGEATIRYEIADGNGGVDTAEVKVTVESVNDVPVISMTSGKGQGDEDSTGIEVTLSASDVDGTVDSFVIQSLPAHGTLFMNGVEVTSAGAVISATDGKASLTFVPDADWSDNNGASPATFEYAAVDNSGAASATGTATINVTAVTDAPTVELTLEPTTTTTLYSVDLSNVLQGAEDTIGNPAGFTVAAYDSASNIVDISIKDSGSPTGFGVTGKASNGADSEIGKQEKLVVELDKPASSATFELAWLNKNDETAVYTVKYSDGTSQTYTVDGNSDEGGYDRIGAPITVNAPAGKSISAIEFSTPDYGDRVNTSDYLLHSVSYESAVTNYTVDITATPTDTDNSENITELMVSTPEGISLSGAEKITTENGVTTWKVSLDSGGFSNKVQVDPDTGVVTVKGLILSVPDDFNGELEVIATATANDLGASDTVDGSDSATIVINGAPEAADDELAGQENSQLVIEPSDLTSNDTDPEGDSLVITSVSNAQNGYVYINADGKVVFTPASGFTGAASFEYTVSDGNGGTDTAMATLDVKAATASASVTVSITEINTNWDGFGSKSDVIDSATHHDYNYNQWQQFDSSDDQIVIDNDVNKWLDAGDGDNSIYVGDDVNRGNSGPGIKTGSGDDDIFVKDSVYSTVQTGGGNDRVQVGYDLGNGYHSAHINLGDGDNKLIIENDVNNYSTVHSGSGDDVVSIGDDVRYDADIQLGDGNDRLTIGDQIEQQVSINLGSGDDILIVGGKVSSSAWVDGGEGTDSILLEYYSHQDYLNNKDGLKWNIANFENIKFSDGTVIGDASVFDRSSVSGYSVTVNVSDLATDETLSSVVIDGVPEGAKLQQSGVDLDVNDDGTYTVSVENGVTSIDNLTVVSRTDSQLDEFELTASINTDGANNDQVGASDEAAIVGSTGDDYLTGGTGEDSLLGGAGDDILFGGSDQVSDTLTGGEGKDIFILNDVTDNSNIDTITDFNAAEDALDLTDLLTGLDDSPSKDADVDAVTKFLNDNVKVTDGHVEVGGEEVANFGPDSNFDSNGIEGVTTADTIKVIYNDQEYNINIDG
ncbi:MAG: tandem-95 repeat protein, partial [Oceanospirillaceae bacterium]|nr:tandem-95 repeat protein [Oceanospirillaceae bacterium]